MRRAVGPVVLVVFVVLLTGCDWPMFRYNSAHTGSSPDTTLSVNNVGSVTQRWHATTGGQIYGAPAIANGIVYVGSEDGSVYAFDDAGTRGCAGTPTICNPLWRDTLGGTTPGRSSPAVANGTLYIGTGNGRVYAFDATGVTGCSGSPKVCAPLWTSSALGFISSSPTVVNGILYIGSNDGSLYAFDATGKNGCSGSPKVCTPLWRAPAGTGTVQSSPAVVAGVVYVGGSGGVYAFDGAGVTHCSGSPKVCTPLWRGVTANAVESSPAVANGVVYAGDIDNGDLYAFDAAGSTGCSGTPKQCTPLWTANTGSFENVSESAAVAKGFVYVGSGDGMFVFDAAGQKNCSGSPKTCTTLGMFAGTGGALTASPAVANGVVYFATGDNHLNAYDARGIVDCSAAPITCSPIFSTLTGINADSSPAIGDGTIFIGDADGTLHAYGLP